MCTSMVWRWFAPLLLCCGLLGCDSLPSAQLLPTPLPDPLVEAIINATPQKGVDKNDLRLAVVLRAVPLQTPVAQAQAVMEQHGFTCQAGVPDADSGGVCLYCTAYKSHTYSTPEKIVVRLFYQDNWITRATVTVDANAARPAYRNWPRP